MLRLIINADDFGLCDSVNKGILDCYKTGLVSDFSFIINPRLC
ncbi:MAG: ChbG/HpnK family deacetylase [Bacteroidales bacterium]|nr:ChbG/HpnK family deacetylase [Bacteroidales bacterium]